MCFQIQNLRPREVVLLPVIKFSIHSKEVFSLFWALSILLICQVLLRGWFKNHGNGKVTMLEDDTKQIGATCSHEGGKSCDWEAEDKFVKQN